MRRDPNNAILNMLYKGTTTIQDFCWDNMTTVPILSLMTVEDIEYIRKLILSPRYSGNNKLKMEKIDEVMHFRGFTRFAGGTNRLVYIHPAAPNAVFKVAIDSVGINDNPAEFRNQQFLKPYCTKIFECSPCGTIASVEKVDRITTFQEFYTIADDYFYLLSRVILGKYVMDDIGIDYFMNIAIRPNFGVVLLDFPYLYELDGAKLECLNELDDGTVCGGEIDYDAGFNKLVCKKCGRVYRAIDLAKPPESRSILIRSKGAKNMKVIITKGDTVVNSFDTVKEREFLVKEAEKKAAKYTQHPEVKLVKVSKPVHKNNVAANVRVQKQIKENQVNSVKALANKPDEDTERVIKNITVSVKKDGIKERAIPADSVSVGLPVNITKEEVEVPVNKEETTTRKVYTHEKPEIVPMPPKKEPKGPVLERVIHVSIDTKKGTSEIIKVDDTPAKFTVKVEKEVTVEEPEVVEDVKKEEPVVETAEEEVEVKTVHKTIEVNLEVEKVEKHTPVIDLEEVKDEEEEEKEEEKEEDVEEVISDDEFTLKMQELINNREVKPAFTFVSDEEKDAIVNEMKSEDEVQEETVEEEKTEEEKVEAAEEPIETAEEIAQEKESEEKEEVKSDDDGYNLKAILYVKELPKEEDIEEDVLYCVPKDPEMDIDDLEPVETPMDIDQELFKIYIVSDGELIRIEYNKETKAWEYVEDEDEEKSESKEESTLKEDKSEEEDSPEVENDFDEDEAIARLKSQGKQSLSDLV